MGTRGRPIQNRNERRRNLRLTQRQEIKERERNNYHCFLI